MNFRERHCTGDATLYLADCLEIDWTADLVVTSPPYNQIDPAKMTHSGMFAATNDAWIEKVQQSGYADNMDENVYQSWLNARLADFLTRCRGTVWINHKIRYRDGVALHPARLMDFPIWSEIIWNRSKSITFNAKRHALSHEHILGFGRPVTWNQKCVSDFTVWAINPKGFDGHPCAFPIQIATRLIDACTDPGNVVCDPFMGSGTTGVAAIDAGRKFIGIEIEKDYFDIACERIDQAQRQQRLFA